MMMLRMGGERVFGLGLARRAIRMSVLRLLALALEVGLAQVLPLLFV